MRGSVYLEDGAVSRQQLSADGLHQTAEDDRSWHLLFVNAEHRVTACIWYLQHAFDASFDDLRVRHSPLAWMTEWRDKLWHAVESELAEARAAGLRYAEIGGWAVTKENRGSADGVLLALAAFSLGRILGGALGMTTATVRHSSSTILRRLGGTHLRSGLTEIPPYFDPKYGCDIELLRFDSRQPSPRYAGVIDALRQHMPHVSVVAHGLAQTQLPALAPMSAGAVPRYVS
jgi:hypothetical protein